MNEPQSKWKWPCDYIDVKGKRCEKPAKLRLHFAWLHPFDHVNACLQHRMEYHSPCRVEDLENELNPKRV